MRDRRPVFVARQVHGTAIARVRAGDDPAALAQVEADGICSDSPGLAVGVFVADCVPALVVDPRTGAFAAVHAGWRGTVAGVLPAAVRALETEFGAHAGDLRVALGPAIGPCCFEVGPEVVAAFEALFPDARARGIVLPSPRGAAGKANVDLKAANRLLLERAGVAPDGDRRGARVHALRSRAFLLVSPRRRRNRPADGRRRPRRRRATTSDGRAGP